MNSETRYVPFRDVVSFAIGGGWGDDSPTDGAEMVAVIRGTDFPSVALGDVATVPRRFESSSKVSKRALRPGDILLEISGGSSAHGQSTGRSLYISFNALSAFTVTAIPASFCRLVRVDTSAIDSYYAYYALQDMYLSGRAAEYEHQSTGISNFQFEHFLDAERIYLPHLEDQRSIAVTLGVLDDKIKLNRRMNQTLEALAAALFKAWFVDLEPVGSTIERLGMEWSPTGLGNLRRPSLQIATSSQIPEGWRCVRVSDMCSTQYGYTASGNDQAVGPRLLRVTDMNKQPWVDWSAVPYCEIDPRLLDRYRLHIGDILVSRMADPGKAAIVEDDVLAVFASYLIRLKTKSLALAYYLFYYLRSDSYLEYVQGAKSGSVQANMNAKVITAAAMLLPPDTVLEAFLTVVQTLRARITSNLRESRTLAVLRDTLLPKLLSGEMKVRHAESLVGAAV